MLTNANVTDLSHQATSRKILGKEYRRVEEGAEVKFWYVGAGYVLVVSLVKHGKGQDRELR